MSAATSHRCAQATEDEQTRDEKIRRASFDIKTAHAASNSSTKLPHIAVAAAARLDQQHPTEDSATQLQLVSDEQEQQEQEGSLSPLKQQQALVLTPQEVLQELLGDMYIDWSRLSMGTYGAVCELGLGQHCLLI